MIEIYNKESKTDDEIVRIEKFIFGLFDYYDLDVDILDFASHIIEACNIKNTKIADIIENGRKDTIVNNFLTKEQKSFDIKGTLLRILEDSDLMVCDECGKLMTEGYEIADRTNNYCSIACLETIMTEEEMEYLNDTGNCSSGFEILSYDKGLAEVLQSIIDKCNDYGFNVNLSGM